MVSKIGALKALVSFYTIFHMNITQEDMDAMEKRFYLTPLVGLIFGAIILLECALILWLSRSIDFGNSIMMAVLVLLTVYAGSKFLHFDGLTDFGDGMIVSGQQSDHLRALKDTLVGAGGIGVALITVLCSFAFYSSYAMTPYILMVFPAVEIFVKIAMVVAASFGRPGNGMAARQVSMTTPMSAVLGIIVGLVAEVVLFIVAGYVCMLIGMAVPPFNTLLIILIVGTIVSVLVGYLMARTANRVFGMVNGDILGATNEVSRPFLLFFILLFLSAVI
jgi:adenosylcobinamide-GDP ribazoletransferase